MSLLGTIFLLTCLPGLLLDFASAQWKNDANMEIRDAYKWLFQAANGGEHAAPSRAAAKQWLDNEWSSLGDAEPDEPLWEPLCDDGTIGRMNLRAFKNRGGKSEDVLNAFLKSAGEYKGDGKTFAAAWNELGIRLKKHPIGVLKYDDWKTFDDEMRSDEYPAVHHSEKYETAHRPAYRIITKTEMEKLLRTLPEPAS